jgi:ribosomal protein L21E
MRIIAVLLAVLVTVMFGSYALPVSAQEPTPAERVVALKAYLLESKTVLRQYEWTETIIVSIDGNEKCRMQHHCYYGADGLVQYVSMDQNASKNKSYLGCDKNNLAGKQELNVYIEDVLRLIRQYIPLNPSGIQAVTENDKLSFNITDPAKQGRLTIRDFVLNGDRVDLDLDLTSNSPVALNINSYYNSKRDPLTLAVTFGSLYGSAAFAREMILVSRPNKLKVTLQNTEFRKVAQ